MDSAQVLEKLYQDIFIERSLYNQIGNYWERGNKNKLDIVAINDLEKIIVISEVKINVDKGISRIRDRVFIIRDANAGYFHDI